MKKCLSCAAPISGEGWTCVCGAAPTTIGGTLCFAPLAVGSGAGYSTEWYMRLAALESGHYWFTARNELITALARSYLPTSGRYMEIGCGTGCVLAALGAAFPGWEVVATELHPEGLSVAGSRIDRTASLIQMDACDIPFRNEFSMIGAFDVIEHIPDDVRAVSEMSAALKSGGMLLITVPQHEALWSAYDVASKHCRRYSRRSLTALLERAGLTVVATTSFVSLALPLLWWVRLRDRRKDPVNFDPVAELELPSWQNRLLTTVMRIEARLRSFGLPLTFGGSLVVAARKP